MAGTEPGHDTAISRFSGSLLRQPRAADGLLEQRLHGGADVVVGRDLEEQAGRGAALQVAGDLRLERRDRRTRPGYGFQNLQ